MTETCGVGPGGRYAFTETDAARTFHHLGELWSLLIDGLDDDAVDRSGVTVTGGEMVDALAVGLGVPYPDAGSIGAALVELGAAAAAAVPTLEPSATSSLLGETWLRLLDVGEALRGAGAFPTQTGRIERVNASSGGVPKAAIGTAEVGWRGLTGDVQRTRAHHGRPWQALCIWSADVIDELRSEGHPVAPGSTGENLTLRGIEWAAVRPGVRLRLGSATCVVSAWATPCSKIAASFTDREFARIDSARGPVSRAYATVIAPGHVAPGDPVTAD